MLVVGALPVYPVQLPASVVAIRFACPVRYSPTGQRKSHRLREIAGVRGLPHTEIHSRYSGVTWRLGRMSLGYARSMCKSIIWAVNSSAYDQKFSDEARRVLGVAPETSEFRIKTKRLRKNTQYFTLVRNMCNCGSLIGLGQQGEPSDEIEAEALLNWLRGMPERANWVSRIAIYNTWSPQDEQLIPRTARGIKICELTESLLRSLEEDALLTIDYPVRA